MKTIILVLGLVCLITSPAPPTVIIQSDLNEFVTSFTPAQPVVHNTYPYGVSISQAPSAIWIWAHDWNNPSTPSPITVSENFYASCGSSMTVYATADNNFTITINGNQVLTGSNWQTVYSATFTPVCGNYIHYSGVNTFSIKAYNYGVGSPTNPAGILYAIVQNNDSCYSCPLGQTWNTKTCACEVIHIII